jgi:CBS-domain-containing membrane protein
VIKLGGLKARIYKETRPGAAYNLMREHAVNGLPVVDAQEKFVGMLMKEDLLDQLIEGLLAHV